MDDLPPSPPRSRQWIEEETESPTEWQTIVLEVKVPACEDRIPIEMDVNETVLKLKEKVLQEEKMYDVPVERVVLQSHTKHAELLDSQMLKDCAVFHSPDDNEIDVYLKPPPPQKVAAFSGGESGKLKVMVLPMNSKQRIEIEVNAEDTVAVLKEKLEQIHRRIRFRLPTGGRYFFIHKNLPMDEGMSFRWHQVQQGDTIDIFDGFLIEDDSNAE